MPKNSHSYTLAIFEVVEITLSIEDEYHSMTAPPTFVFETTGMKADEALIREYVLDAIERLPEQPGCDGIGFHPMGCKADFAAMDYDGGVLLRIMGKDMEPVVEQERDRWDSLIDEALAKSWNQSEIDQEFTTNLGEHGAELYIHLELLAAQMSKFVYESDTLTLPVDPVDEYPGEERESRLGVGWWRLLHLLSLHQNYRFVEEIDAYSQAVRYALHNIARLDEYERAIATTDEVIEDLEAVREELAQIQTEVN